MYGGGKSASFYGVSGVICEVLSLFKLRVLNLTSSVEEKHLYANNRRSPCLWMLTKQAPIPASKIPEEIL